MQEPYETASCPVAVQVFVLAELAEDPSGACSVFGSWAPIFGADIDSRGRGGPFGSRRRATRDSCRFRNENIWHFKLQN